VAVACTAALLVLFGPLAATRDGSLLAGPGNREAVVRVPDDPQLRRGFEIWAVLCAPCHGQTGEGNGPVAAMLTVEPGDLTDPDAVAFATDPGRKQVIAEGIDGSPMIGWKEVLTDREIEVVNGYLRYLLKSGRDGDRDR